MSTSNACNNKDFSHGTRNWRSEITYYIARLTAIHARAFEMCIHAWCSPSWPWLQFLATSGNTGCNINLRHDCKTPAECLLAYNLRCLCKISHSKLCVACAFYLRIYHRREMSCDTSTTLRTINECSKQEPRVLAVVCRLSNIS